MTIASSTVDQNYDLYRELRKGELVMQQFVNNPTSTTAAATAQLTSLGALITARLA